MASFRLDEPGRAVPEPIRDAARRVSERLGVPCNGAGLNLYRDGRDSVAPHHDHLDEIQLTPTPDGTRVFGAIERCQ